MAETIVIVGAKRTPIGSMQGKFNSVSASQLGSAAIKATCYAYNRRKPTNTLLVLRRKMAEIGMLSLGAFASMIASHIGNKGQFVPGNSRQSTIQDELKTMLVVRLVVDQVPHILQESGKLEDAAVFCREFLGLRQAIKDLQSKHSRMLRVR